MSIRPIIIEGALARVRLTQGRETIIDAADVPLVEGQPWQAWVNHRQVYAIGKHRSPDGVRHSLFLHRLLMFPPVGIVVDHIDGDGLNNRRCNLRLATIAQNAWNQGKSAQNRSGYKGVFWCRHRQRFVARIQMNGKIKSLGQFGTAEQAYAAYAKAAIDLHGQFVRLA